MITTTSHQESLERLQPPTLFSLRSISAAAALLFSDGTLPERILASDSRALEMPSAIRYSVSDLERLESFSQSLGQGDSLLSLIQDREVVFNFLRADGVLDAIPLHPLERRALEMLRDNNVDAVQFAILKTRARLVQGTFTQSDMFGSLATSDSNGQPSSRDLPQEIATDYSKLLGFCQFLTGRLVLASSTNAPHNTHGWLSSLPPKRASTITQVVGALVINERLSPATYASYFGERLLISQADSITQDEVSHIPLLKGLGRYSSHPWLFRAFVLAQGALCYGLYRSISRRAEAIDAKKSAQEAA